MRILRRLSALLLLVGLVAACAGASDTDSTEQSVTDAASEPTAAPEPEPTAESQPEPTAEPDPEPTTEPEPESAEPSDEETSTEQPAASAVDPADDGCVANGSEVTITLTNTSGALSRVTPEIEATVDGVTGPLIGSFIRLLAPDRQASLTLSTGDSVVESCALTGARFEAPDDDPDPALLQGLSCSAPDEVDDPPIAITVSQESAVEREEFSVIYGLFNVEGQQIFVSSVEPTRFRNGLDYSRNAFTLWEPGMTCEVLSAFAG